MHTVCQLLGWTGADAFHDQGCSSKGLVVTRATPISPWCYEPGAASTGLNQRCSRLCDRHEQRRFRLGSNADFGPWCYEVWQRWFLTI